MIGVTMETLRNVQIIDAAVARWDRRQANVVRDAYTRIMTLEQGETGRAVDPKGHAQWLDGIARGVGIRVVKKDSLDSLLRELDACASCDDVLNDEHEESCVALFDPSTHFIVVSQPSVLSYLAEPMVARVDEFGENAMAVSPTFKCSVLWWNV